MWNIALETPMTNLVVVPHLAKAIQKTKEITVHLLVLLHAALSDIVSCVDVLNQ